MPDNVPNPQPENDVDPSASTQMFQAFVDRYEPGGSGSSRTPAVLLGVGLVGLVIVAVLLWLTLGG